MSQITATTKDAILQNLKTTRLGFSRIARNLNLSDLDEKHILEYCTQVIRDTPLGDIQIRGKNYYVSSNTHMVVLTVNRSSLGIITAKMLDQ